MSPKFGPVCKLHIQKCNRPRSSRLSLIAEVPIDVRFHSLNSELADRSVAETFRENALCERLSRAISLCKTFVLGARKHLDNRSRWFILAGIKNLGVEGRDASWVRQSGRGLESELWRSPGSVD
jgi:hypothetical protein